MREKCDQLEEKVRKLKKAVKVYAARLKDSGLNAQTPEGGLALVPAIVGLSSCISRLHDIYLVVNFRR